MKNPLARRSLVRASAAALPIAALPMMACPTRLAAANARAGSSAQMDHRQVQILFADLQPALVAGSRTVSPEALTRSAGVLAEVASILGIPMLFSVVPEGNAAPSLLPVLQPYATEANTLRRTLAGPFMDPPTATALGAHGRRTLIVAGFAAEVVVLQATLDAIGAGYEVQCAVDAIGGLSERTEAAALRHAELAGAVPTSVLSLTTRLTPDFFRAPGSKTFAALRPLL